MPGARRWAEALLFGRDSPGLPAPAHGPWRLYDAGMGHRLPEDLPNAVAAAAGATAGLELFILYGSRARGDAHGTSDWDFGYLADEAADVAGLLATLVEILGDDNIDLVDLDRTTGLLRFRSACDGVLLHEAESGVFDRYRLDAARFWCENASLFRQGYEEILEAL